MEQIDNHDKKEACSCGSVSTKSQCCTGSSSEIVESGEHWVTGIVNTPAGKIPQVSTKLTLYDTMGY